MLGHRKQIEWLCCRIIPLAVPRRGSRIQKGGGGGFVHSEGGVSYRNFRSGFKLLQGPGQINKQHKIADSRRGGGGGGVPIIRG